MGVSLSIGVNGKSVPAELDVPDGAYGVVVFAHGTGSSRHSPRNRMVADRLRSRGFGTLLGDLLTVEEAEQNRITGKFRFDVDLLASRLTAMVDTVVDREDTAGLPIGLFGGSTGAAAALVTAVNRASTVRAVVGRGGRPDLAEAALERVTAPTLLIVGGADTEILAINHAAAKRLRAVCQVHVVPGAGHLFGEPGALEEVAERAAEWFGTYLPPAAPDGTQTVLDGYDEQR